MNTRQKEYLDPVEARKDKIFGITPDHPTDRYYVLINPSNQIDVWKLPHRKYSNGPTVEVLAHFDNIEQAQTFRSGVEHGIALWKERMNALLR